MTWTKAHISEVRVMLPDLTKLSGRSVRFTTERSGRFRKSYAEVCYLTDFTGTETRIGPIATLEWT